MIVDDRLETVLRTNVAGKTAGRTQLRQLVDLLGLVPLAGWTTRHATALERVDSLAAQLTDEECAAVLRGTSHRSAVLVYHFAQGGPRTASAAIASAHLPDDDWLALIPRLPTRARGFLRHRADLGESVRQVLSRLGVDDFLLEAPDVTDAPESASATPSEPVTLAHISAELPADEGIGAIVRRIEAFRRKREQRDASDLSPRPDGVAPLLPFGDDPEHERKPPHAIDLRTDAGGTVVQAEVDPAGMLVGSRVFSSDTSAPVRCDDAMALAFRQRQPVSAGLLTIEGADAVSGIWQADGTPCFARDGGRFTGYLLRLRRRSGATALTAAVPAPSSEADRLRQLLHELRTPINAVQGFAEVIQQQVFGPTPHQYRAMAANIAADAANMLAGFEEVERLVRLESRALDIDTAEADAAFVIAGLVEQVMPVLAARNVRLTLVLPSSPVQVAFAAEEIERSVWRVLSVIASSVAPGERLTIALEEHETTAVLAITLPAALRQLDDAALFAPDARGNTGPASPSAMLGNGFALRLARAELQGGHGMLHRENDKFLIALPYLTAALADHTPASSTIDGPIAGRTSVAG
ncbi:hypothetical protein GGQ88_000225 [Novosphingobium hassiacum]|uniref:histidine kinase n=1 Tax=Novosphingobium hassiacum TaxID=173676 RepID=A0A7W5ZS36_9SPHN|nr:HAMP domain-containing histidine kinase [Novosphingobium hassiacum]MBB3858985.1 hypothetical protein [Novosphingobium hassiacum]